MNAWLSEVWHAWRASLRRPGYLLLAAGVLALGIGSTTAVFALLQGTLLKPLPYPHASQLVVMGTKGAPGFEGAFVRASKASYQHISGLEGVESAGIGTSLSPSNVYVDGKPVQVPTTLADQRLLPTLGVRLVAGHNFSAADTQANGPKVVIIGYAFWQRFFGGGRGVVGKTLSIEGVAHTVIGILPKGFQLFGQTDLMLPLTIKPGSRNINTNYVAVARLAAGTRLASLSAQYNTRMSGFLRTLPMSASSRKYWSRARFVVVPLQTERHSNQRVPLLLVLACALLLLLIGLVNLANLTLLRALAKGHDGAIRRALGASRWRQAIPILADALLVGLIAGIAGVILAALALTALRHGTATNIVDLGGVSLRTGTVVLAIVVGILAALLAAVLGLWRSHRQADIESLREGGRSGLGRGERVIGRVLVVTQVVLATVLLIVTGLFGQALYQAAHAQLGFAHDNVLTFELAPVKGIYKTGVSVEQLSHRVLRQLKAQPGVEAAVATTNLPVGEQFNIGSVHAPGGFGTSTQFRAISPGFFRTFGIHLRKGRAFTREDVHGSAAVAIINRALAERDYGGQALGKVISYWHGPGAVEARIVAVVDNTSQNGAFRPQPAILYVPLTQVPMDLLNAFRYFEPMRFAIRVKGKPASHRDAVREAVASVAPTQPIANIRTLGSIVAETTANARLVLLLISVMGGMALSLAASGLYAVMAVSVAAREREIGVRMALGAAPARLLRGVLTGGVWQVAVGLVAGIGIATGFAQLLKNLLFLTIGRRNALDPAIIAAVCVVLLTAGITACLIPAWRAARVQPMHALRGE